MCLRFFFTSENKRIIICKNNKQDITCMNKWLRVTIFFFFFSQLALWLDSSFRCIFYTGSPQIMLFEISFSAKNLHGLNAFLMLRVRSLASSSTQRDLSLCLIVEIAFRIMEKLEACESANPIPPNTGPLKIEASRCSIFPQEIHTQTSTT